METGQQHLLFDTRLKTYVSVFLATALFFAVTISLTPSKTLSAASSSKYTAARAAANQKHVQFSPEQKANYHKTLQNHLKHMQLDSKSQNRLPEKIENALETFQRWIGQMASKLSKKAKFVALPVHVLYMIIKTLAFLLVTLACIGLIYLLVLLIAKSFEQKDKLKEEISAVHWQEQYRAIPYTEVLEKAETMYNRDNFYEALRLIHFAVILMLFEAKLIIYSADKTNRDYLRTLKGQQNHVLYEIVFSLTEAVNNVVYGGASAVPADYKRAKACVNKLEEMI